MPKVNFISPDGETITVEAAEGTSLMRAAVDQMVPGIDADCGGACACATCHVYVDPDWLGRLPTPVSLEVDMLECAVDPQANSRLSCQIELTSALDGLVVRIPSEQA